MSLLVPEVEGLHTGTGDKGHKETTNCRCTTHDWSLKSSSIQFFLRCPTFLSSPQGIQGYTMTAAAPGLTLTQESCQHQPDPHWQVLSRGKKILLRLCLSRDRADTSDTVWLDSAHTGPQESENSPGSNGVCLRFKPQTGEVHHIREIKSQIRIPARNG